ncbi:cytochrome P450 [Sphingobacterium multivorum]|uniref:Cytochrome P450 n=1 Tax=Sphingobacterium multivorum TaxID=28454 RepID=A0ABX7CHK3_SPHMU|nr:cytochrome P450 [Sphingobacterium multivorum]QQT32606.1 cytochrome P450 [Sphingobacterium multivorum]QQT51476.1 cytochrome P450 [Sphingobacterium multivorum]
MIEVKDEYWELRDAQNFNYDKSRRCYLATTQEDVERFLKSDDVTVEYLFRASRHVFGKTMLDSDSPEMLTIKREVARFFTLKAIKCYEVQFIKKITEDLIQTIRQQNDEIIDFHREIAQRIPTKVILALYGIDEGLDIEIFYHLDKLVRYIDNPNYPLTDALNSKQYLTDFLVKCLSGSIKLDKNGLISSIDRNLFEDEQDLINTLLMVLAAGMATTISAFDALILKMYEEKDKLKFFITEKEIKDFISESLMEDPPLHSTVRFVKTSLEYKGKELKKFDNINVNLASANFEQVCPITGNRSAKTTSYTFGKGKHACLGSHLAISELVIFVQEFLPFIEEFKLGQSPEDLLLTGTTIKTYSNIKLKRT